MAENTTLEFFGTTTFRLQTSGLTILHDTWLEKPDGMKRYLELADVTHLDYILISHAHFDHLPGADRLALKTGATVIANAEAINCLRSAGVPETQLIAVAGGERVPLYTKQTLAKAADHAIDLAPGPPSAPARPHVKYATMSVHVWPSLHSLMPASNPHDIPETFDTGTSYTGGDDGFACSHDITVLMQHGLFRMKELYPESEMDAGTRAFAEFVHDRKRHLMSHYDGGQLLFNVITGDKAILFNTHLGAYEGILKCLDPKPDVAILGAGGRANLNGRPYQGSAADFLVGQVKWLEEPADVFMSLHDESVIKPYRTDCTAAKERIEGLTSSKVTVTECGVPYRLFERA